MQPLLAVFAHPDDETFGAAGVMAAAVERGVPVTVISATRGEAGESSIAGLDDPERLGVVRERELREAMRQIGVSDVRLLGYRDSGMAGSPSAEDPQAFIRAPVETVAARLASHIRISSTAHDPHVRCGGSLRAPGSSAHASRCASCHPDRRRSLAQGPRRLRAVADARSLFCGVPPRGHARRVRPTEQPAQIPAGGCPGKCRHASLANHAHRSISNRGRSANAPQSPPIAPRLLKAGRWPVFHRKFVNGSSRTSISSGRRFPGLRRKVATPATSSRCSRPSRIWADLPKSTPTILVPSA